MGRKHLSLMEKDSRLAKMITQSFNKKTGRNFSHLGEILDLFANIGESCDTLATRLKKFLNDSTLPEIKHTTFGNAVRLYIQQGKTSFKIAAKHMKNNQFRKEGSGRKQY